MFDSKWNRALRRYVAKTFKRAILRFSKDHPLEFTWIRYLPSLSISDPFWASLRDQVLNYLRDEEILQSWYGGIRKQADQLRCVPSDALDVHGNPLLLAPTEEPVYDYISPKYSNDDLELLWALGVRPLSDAEFCHSLFCDLLSVSSTFKSIFGNDDWRSRIAKKLQTIAESNLPLLQDLKCIPLQDGSWVSACEGNLYFPEYQKVPIPTDLGLKIVHGDALMNTTTKALYSTLGVQQCSPKLVNSRILNKYNSLGVELQSSVTHLRWLYHFLPEEKRDLERRIPLFANDGVPTYRRRVPLGKEDMRVGDLYFESEDEFGVQELCRKRQTTIPPNETIQYQVNFVNEKYLKAVESTVRVHNVTWIEWLEISAGVRRVPRLVKKAGSTELSKLFSWLISKRPEQVVGTLHAHWGSYKDQMKPELVKSLRKVKVLQKGEWSTELKDAWMPTEKLVKLSEGFDLHADMPFLELPVVPDGKAEDWKFLAEFGVGFDADMSFHLAMLIVLQDASWEPKSFPERLLKLYEAIEKNSNSSNYEEIRYDKSSDKVIESNGHSGTFSEYSLILAPPSSGQDMCWIDPQSCIWDAPDFIDCRTILGSFDGYRSSQSLKNLLCNILKISNINSTIYVEQLADWKKKGEIVAVDEVYRLLQSILRTEEGETIRLVTQHNHSKLPLIILSSEVNLSKRKN